MQLQSRCAECDITFTFTPYPSRPTRRFCSTRCAGKAGAAVFRKGPRVTCTCAWCGVTFERSPSGAREPRQFCSTEHYHLACGHGSVEERFWARVVQRRYGCWDWTGEHSGKYGTLKLSDGHRKLAHRLSWELHCGPIPDGLKVLHRCDNPPCTRPEHLWLGTQRQNVADMIAKRRKGAPGHVIARTYLSVIWWLLHQTHAPCSRPCCITGEGALVERVDILG
jgi:hypothetical protein